MKFTFLGFSAAEMRGAVVIFILLFLAILINMNGALRKSRDAQRRSDIQSIADSLVAFHEDFGFFPQAYEGKIVACDGKLNDTGVPVFSPCDWLYDSLRDSFDLSYPPYMERIPTDPQHNDGARYYYISNGSRFQIYGAYESDSEPEYKAAVVARNLPCGDQICNFGRAYSTTPVDRSIEEFESDVNAKRK